MDNKAVLRVLWSSIVYGASLTAVVRADVTVQQNTSLDVAAMIRVHGTTTTSITPDKKREDVESHCEGVMSLLCGNVRSGEIVRLDRDVTWQLEPDKKRYREQVFATPEELAAVRAKMQANLEKMRSCPVSRRQEPIDKSKCEMAPPKIEVHKTEDKASIAGHDAQRTSTTLTETCTNKETGDVCDTIIALDVWLTQDKLPGSADRRAFDGAYARKLGLDELQGMIRGQAASFLAPYQAQIKQLTEKSGDLKGQPLKTSLRVLVGGPQCSVAKGKPGGDPSGASPMSDVAEKSKALGASVGHLVGGLFHKKNADDGADTGNAASAADTQASTTAGSAPSATAKTPDAFAQHSQLAQFTVETTTINTDPVSGGRFEIPADWTLEVPKAGRTNDAEYTCPKT